MTAETKKSQQPSGISILAVIVGWIAIEVVAFVIGFLAASMYGQTQTAWTINIWGGFIVGGLIGGYVAGGMAKRSGATHGFLSASISVALAFILAYSQVESVDPILTPEVLFPWGVGLLCAVIGGSLSARSS